MHVFLEVLKELKTLGVEVVLFLPHFANVHSFIHSFCGGLGPRLVIRVLDKAFSLFEK